MDRRDFLRLAGLGLTASTVPSCTSLLHSFTDKKPNVLFISVDDLNHWCGYTGRNEQAKTPNIDRLSQMGVSFTNAHCPAPACQPSRTAIFSGLRPNTSGCYRNKDTQDECRPQALSLNAKFKRSGYKVMATGKMYHWYPKKYQQSSATDYSYEWDEYPRVARSSTGGATSLEGYLKPHSTDIQDEDLADWHSVNYCIEQLQRPHDKPFFLACGLFKPHLPWAVPQKYYEMYPREEIALPPHLKGDLDDLPNPGKNMGNTADHPRFIESGRWRDAIQAYLATIAYADVCIGRLLDAWEQSAYNDNTIIVLWGDHGWHLGEKQRWRKYTLWEEATRAPLIWYAPGMTRANSLCHKPVDLMSIYPTLCSLTDIETPAHVEGDNIRPLLQNPEAPWQGVAISTHGYRNHAVRTERWRYIRYATGDEELYDHSKDEYEWTNLAGDPAYAQQMEHLAQYLPKSDFEPAYIKAKKEKRAQKKRKKST